MSYRGYVFDSEKKPLPGIRVSDGKNVCVTDETGAFSLPGWEKTSLIFCNVLTEKHDDWYLPVEDNKETYEFCLHLSKSCSDHSFLHIGDTEIGNRGCDSFLPFLREKAREQNAAFLMHGGDIAGEEAMVRHREEMNFDTVGCPVRYNIGNHDYLDGAYGEQRFEELYGPVWFSFDVGQVRYAALSIPKGSGGFKSGYSLDDQYLWLQNDLAHSSETKSLVIFRHNHCEEGNHFVVPFKDGSLNLKDLGLIAWLHGHDHTVYANENRGILQMGSAIPDSGGIDNTAAGARCTRIKGNELKTEILYNTHPFEEKADAVWSVKLPGTIEYASLLEVEDSLICATCDDGFPKQCGVYRLEEKSGRILWFYPTVNSIKNHLATDGEAIYCQDCEGWVYAICFRDGSLKWKTNIKIQNSNIHELSDNSTHYKNGVVLSGDTLLAGNGKIPVFLNKKDGSVRFRGEVGNKGESAPAGTVLSDDGNTVFYSGQWLRLLALDAKTGETRWDLRSQKEKIGNHGAFWYRTNTPLYHNGKIYAFGFSRAAIADAKTGEILLHKAIPAKTEVVGSALIYKNTLYFPTGKQGVLAMDAETLEVKYQYPVGGAQLFTSSYVFGKEMTVESSPFIQNDQLIFAANDGYVYFYETERPTLIRKVKLAFASLTAPIVKKDHLFAASFDGTVGKYAY